MSAPNDLSFSDTDPAITCDECGAQDVLYFGHAQECTITVAESFARWESERKEDNAGNA